MDRHLEIGKIPPELLQEMLSGEMLQDPRLVLGPGMGLDCAVLDMGDRYLVLKSDPITFATQEIGWYAVQVNANDIATTGAVPKWFLATLLLPEAKTSEGDVLEINRQLRQACQEIGVGLIGGHTEVTAGLDRPLIAGTMIGEVRPADLVTPRGASPGDTLLLTKSVPIEATAILARERPERLAGSLTPGELDQARAYLLQPGISVLTEARTAVETGGVTAMHDPTEGGVAAALWELAAACGQRLVVDADQIPISPLSEKICRALDLDPLAAIASGALLITAPAESADRIRENLGRGGIPCAAIGQVESGAAEVLARGPEGMYPLKRPPRDELARMFES